jgi:recombination protein RecT
MSTIGNAVQKRDKSPQGMIRQYRSDFASVLPSHLAADSWVRVAQGVLRRNKELAEVATANPGSFLAVLLDCARLGLEPGDTYHLVPFGGEVVGIPDYKGLIELIYRAGAVSSVKAEVVYEHDEYDYDRDTMDRPRHRSEPFASKAQRGKMIGAYAYCEMKDGGTSRVVEMAEWEILEHKAVSKTAKRPDSMWNRWPRSAWLKTVCKELEKWVPSSPEWITHKVAAERAGTERPELSVSARALPEPVSDAEPVDAELVEPDPEPAPEDRKPKSKAEREQPEPEPEPEPTPADESVPDDAAGLAEGAAAEKDKDDDQLWYRCLATMPTDWDNTRAADEFQRATGVHPEEATAEHMRAYLAQNEQATDEAQAALDLEGA